MGTMAENFIYTSPLPATYACLALLPATSNTTSFAFHRGFRLCNCGHDAGTPRNIQLSQTCSFFNEAHAVQKVSPAHKCILRCSELVSNGLQYSFSFDFKNRLSLPQQSYCLFHVIYIRRIIMRLKPAATHRCMYLALSGR